MYSNQNLYNLSRKNIQLSDTDHSLETAGISVITMQLKEKQKTHLVFFCCLTQSINSHCSNRDNYSLLLSQLDLHRQKKEEEKMHQKQLDKKKEDLFWVIVDRDWNLSEMIYLIVLSSPKSENLCHRHRSSRDSSHHVA